MGKYSVGPYQRHFDGWANALEAAGLDPDDRPGQHYKLSDETLIEHLHELTDVLGHPPTLQEFRDHGEYGAMTYFGHFGSWRNALQAAGFEDRPPIEAASRQELIDELHRLAEKHTQRPTTTLMDEKGKFWASTYRNHFASWSAAMEAAGWEPKKLEFSREELLEDLREFADELGHRPTFAEMNERGPHSTFTYANQFGSWSAALEEAGLD